MISGSLSSRHGASSGCGWRNGPLIWRAAANIMNKQSRSADKGWSSSLGLGEVLTSPRRKNISCYEIFTRTASDQDFYSGSGLGQVAGTCECGNEPSSSMKCGEFLD
jgi:hypothetical protein